MKNLKKFLFAITTVACVLAFMLALTACVDKDPDTPPPPSTPEAKILTADEVRSVLSAIPVVDDNVKISLGEQSIGISTYNGYSTIHESEIRNGNTENIYIGLHGSQGCRYVIGHAESKAVLLTDAEYAEVVYGYKETFAGLSQIVNRLIDESEDAKKALGSAFYEKYAGVLETDGTYNLEIETMIMESDTVLDYDISVSLDSEKRLTKIKVKGGVNAGYAPSNRDMADMIDAEFSYTYGESIGMPSVTSLSNRSDSVSISFANGAVMPDEFTAEAEAGGEITLPAPANAGGSFLGWYYDEDLRIPVEDNILKVTYSSSHMYVYAKWNLPVPDFRLNGGILSDEYLEEAKTIFVLSDFEYLIPVKEGYEFAGWYKDSAFTQRIDYNDRYLIDGNTKLYAKYDKLVTVSFVTNSDYAVLPKSGVEGEGMNAPQVVKKGYFFKGWCTDIACTNLIDDKYPAEDATYYAKFEKGINVNLVVYDGFVYSSVPKFITIPNDGTLDTLNYMLDAYYSNLQYNGTLIFDHWAVNESGTEISAYPTRETTLYAIYAESITVTAHPDASLEATTHSDPVQVLKERFSSYDAFLDYLKSGLTLPAGKEFDGWYSDSAMTALISDTAEWPSASVDIYGRFIDIRRFTLELNGGSLSGNIDLAYNTIDNAGSVKSYFCTYGILPYPDGGTYDGITAPAGKYLAGWYTDSGLTTRFTAYDGIPRQSMTLYAKYEDIIYLTLSLAEENAGMDWSVALSWNSGSEEVSILDYYRQISWSITAFTDYAGYIESRVETMLGSNSIRHNNGTYNFEGLYTDAACAEAYVPGDEFESRTLYVKFVAAQS